MSIEGGLVSSAAGTVSTKIVGSSWLCFFFLAGGASLCLGGGRFCAALLDKYFGQSKENVYLD